MDVAQIRSAEYVVVGGGTAGSVLAARLTEDADVRVVLIEAGPAQPPTAPPPLWPTLSGSAGDWADVSVLQEGLGAPRSVAHGRGLGGGSAINALAHLRGHRAGYDGWAADGRPAWGFDDLLPFFTASETAPGRDLALRGQRGPMRVGAPGYRGALAASWLEACAAVAVPRAEDPSSGAEVGVGWLDRNVVDGVRQSAADAYLRPVASRPNLEIRTDSTALRLVLRQGRCVGVEVASDGRRETIEASREVILAAGAIGSPHLLLRSGIGPADDLRRIGVEVEVDSPRVGMNLQDHPLAGVHYAVDHEVPVASDQTPNEVGGTLFSGLGDTEVPDLQLICSDIVLLPPGPGVPGPGRAFTIGFSAMLPCSRGSVRLVSDDPTARPRIDPGYLAEESDRAVMRIGLERAREVGARMAEEWGATEIAPGPASTRDEVDAYLRVGTVPYAHHVGTCALGSDDGDVVDLDLRVRGVAGLRVVDASVLPSLPSANTNATVLAVAERTAAHLRG